MIDNKLHRLLPIDLDAEEIGYYYDAVATDIHSGGVEVVSSLILDGAMDLWCYNYDDTILVCITRFIDYPDGYREMLVAMMAGTNVTDTMSHEKIHSELMAYAVRERCGRMIAYMRPEIWEHMKPRLIGYVEEYVQISLAPEVALSEDH